MALVIRLLVPAGTADSAYSGRYMECCSLLIQGGAELEIADTIYGRTAAHWAVYYHRNDILATLIESGESQWPNLKVAGTGLLK